MSGNTEVNDIAVNAQSGSTLESFAHRSGAVIPLLPLMSTLLLVCASLLIHIITAVDLRTIQCTPGFGKWSCWWAQTCSDTLYVCNGDAPDAPPFTAIAFGWVVFGGIIATIIGLGLLAVAILFATMGAQRVSAWCKKKCPCCNS